jgi:Fe-S-cluster containining protein
VTEQVIVAGSPEPEPEPVEREHLGCAMCGDCCESIKASLSGAGFTAVVSTSGGVSISSKQAVEGWGRRLYAAGVYMRDAAFIRRWMEPTGEVTKATRWTDEDGNEQWRGARQIWRCLKFDTERRICTAHNERPQMCAEYPFYGKPPSARNGPNDDELRCSYWLAIDPADRPEGARPLIPLEVLR